MSLSTHTTTTATFAASATAVEQPLISHTCAGLRMTPAEYDAHENWEPGYRYELIDGALVVNPPPPFSHQGPVLELLTELRIYQRTCTAIDFISHDVYVAIQERRRIADAGVWCGLGRRPIQDADVPAILIEAVSPGTGQHLRDYEQKRDEYLSIGVKEYWVFDRFERGLTIFCNLPTGHVAQIIREPDLIRSALLPGFELPLATLLACADGWTEGE